MSNKIKSEDGVEYKTEQHSRAEEDAIINQALAILENRLQGRRAPLKIGEIGGWSDAKNLIQLTLAEKEAEEFGAIWLDNRHRVLSMETLFRGTIDGASVYPREVVKAALKKNAAAVIFYHNHPSGVTLPSREDEMITKKLKDALDLVDVRVLDHFIMGEGEPYSFGANGLI